MSEPVDFQARLEAATCGLNPLGLRTLAVFLLSHIGWLAQHATDPVSGASVIEDIAAMASKHLADQQAAKNITQPALAGYDDKRFIADLWVLDQQGDRLR